MEGKVLGGERRGSGQAEVAIALEGELQIGLALCDNKTDADTFLPVLKNSLRYLPLPLAPLVLVAHTQPLTLSSLNPRPLAPHCTAHARLEPLLDGGGETGM